MNIFFFINQEFKIFIHESIHSFDKGRSASQVWHDAVAGDSCIPDAYVNADNFAQVVVLWVYLVGKGRNQDFGGDQFACMKNQLELMAIYLLATSFNI